MRERYDNRSNETVFKQSFVQLQCYAEKSFDIFVFIKFIPFTGG